MRCCMHERGRASAQAGMAVQLFCCTRDFADGAGHTLCCRQHTGQDKTKGWIKSRRGGGSAKLDKDRQARGMEGLRRLRRDGGALTSPPNTCNALPLAGWHLHVPKALG
jgi:hypothetical protein